LYICTIMKKLLILITAVIATAAVVQARSNANVKPQLQFRADSTFKVVQFTDLHLSLGLKGEYDAVLNRIDHIVKTENPDFVVFTGDQVWSKPCGPVWEQLIGQMDGYKIPWCVMYGNHDAEQDLSRSEMSKLISSGKYSMNRLNDKSELADVQLPVKASDGRADTFYLFCMDSNDYSGVSGIKGYGWFTTSQVEWLRERCIERTDSDGRVAPSLAFFHIPLREYIDAWATRDNPRKGSGDSKYTVGLRGENIACGELNTGMFAAMRETGSVIGVSVGHDHDSDFIAVYHDIALCYGRYTGGNSVYNHLPSGARVFLIREDVPGFETWVREESDRVLHHVYFDGDHLTGAPRAKGKTFGTWTDMQTR